MLKIGRSFAALAWLGVLVMAGGWGLAANASAQASVPSSIVYRLLPESALLRGCFGPCLCPVETGQDLQGNFELERVPGNPADPFALYKVSNVAFFVTLGGRSLRITGSGTYRVGGEVAVTQQMTLELQIDDQLAEKFDSGLVAGGGDFPRIAIDLSMNGQSCFDTVLQIRAEPTPPGDLDGDGVPNDLDDCPRTSNPDQADRDGDGIGDACDLCPDYASLDNDDVDHNGIGDVCECGDQTGNGIVNVADIVAINAAIFGRIPVSPLCDTNDDGKCDVRDIVGASDKIFGMPAYCSRYPPPSRP